MVVKLLETRSSETALTLPAVKVQKKNSFYTIYLDDHIEKDFLFFFLNVHENMIYLFDLLHDFSHVSWHFTQI